MENDISKINIKHPDSSLVQSHKATETVTRQGHKDWLNKQHLKRHSLGYNIHYIAVNMLLVHSMTQWVRGRPDLQINVA